MYNFMYLFLFHRIYPNCILFSLPFSKSPLPSFAPRSNAPSFLLRAVLPMISTKLGIRRCNKTRNVALYQDWMRQPSKKKNVPQAGKFDSDTATIIIRSSTKTQATVS